MTAVAAMLGFLGLLTGLCAVDAWRHPARWLADAKFIWLDAVAFLLAAVAVLTL